MKKGLKFGIVALSLVAMAMAIFNSTENANAANTASVELRPGSNTCVFDDYDWQTVDASISDVTLTGITHTLVCTLLGATGGNVQIQLGNLVGAVTLAQISKGNFEVGFSNVTQTGSLETSGQTPGNLGEARQVFVKGANLVGQISADVTITGSIDAGQQIDAYTGELNVLINA